MTTEKELERGVSDLVGALSDPIIVFPGGWEDTLPEWLKNAITTDRLIMNILALKGEEMTGTDAEACAYLYTTSLTQPIGHDWAQIYFYIANRVYSRKGGEGQMPEDIRVEKLSDHQMGELRRLKQWLYERRVQARQERGRAERRQQREKVKEELKQQPLFPF